MSGVREQVHGYDPAGEEGIPLVLFAGHLAQVDEVVHGGLGVAAHIDQLLDVGGPQGEHGLGVQARPRGVHDGNCLLTFVFL